MAKAQNSIYFSTNRFHLEKAKEIYDKKQDQGERSLLTFLTLRRICLERLQGHFTQDQLFILLDLMAPYRGTIPNQASANLLIIAIEEIWHLYGRGDLNDLRQRILELHPADLYFLLEECYRFYNDKKAYKHDKRKFVRLFA